MSLNKKILENISQKTVNNIEMKNFLIELLQFESKRKGWFKNDYAEILEKYCKSGDK